jgi:ATP-dependent Clp protease adaptor protein ClpS
MVKHKDSPSAGQQDSSAIEHGLILYNDDVNTFDFVIDTLMAVCDHQQEQAEQCALITHYKGKCKVKTGDYYEVKPMCDEMTFRGLTVSIE